MSDKKEFTVWTVLTRIGQILTICWIIFQAYNFYLNSKSLNYELNANFFKYSLQADAKTNFNNFNKLKELIDKDLGNTRITEFDMNSLSFMEPDKKTVDLLSKYKVAYPINIEEYNTYWTFALKNIGNQPLEELYLEIPNSGSYVFSTSEGGYKTENFKNRIELGKVKPAHSINISVWTKEYDNDKSENYYFDDFEEKVRFTHKSGAINVTFPKEVSGFYKWIFQNDFILILISIFGISLLVYYSFIFGRDYGPELQEEMMKEEIKKFDKIENFKKILSEKKKTKEDE